MLAAMQIVGAELPREIRLSVITKENEADATSKQNIGPKTHHLWTTETFDKCWGIQVSQRIHFILKDPQHC